MSRTSGLTAGGDFHRVWPTPEEMDEWRRKNPDRRSPAVYRVRCRACGKRMWGSGIGIGAHRKACPGEGKVYA